MSEPLEEMPAEGALGTIRASREDSRPRLPEPPPVTLVAIADVRLPAVAGLEAELDGFYEDLLGFEPVEGLADGEGGRVYRAENHALSFVVLESSPEEPWSRPLGVITPHYLDILQRLGDLGVEYEVIRGLASGDEAALFQDPAGNWLSLMPRREVR